jgi:hypothetical protein
MGRGEHVIKFVPSKQSCLGLLPRYAKNDFQICWFTIPTCLVFHNGMYLIGCSGLSVSNIPICHIESKCDPNWMFVVIP